MKRIHHVLFAILAMVLLVSCTGAPDEGGTETGTPKNTPEVVKLIDYLSDKEFDAHNAGIVDGSSLPTELHYHVDNSSDISITDPELMADVWKRLCAIEIDVANIDRVLSILDGGISYEFMWEDGSSIFFNFEVFDYFTVRRGLIPIVGSNELRQLDSELNACLEQQGGDKSFAETLTIGDVSFRSLEPVSSDGSNYKWDFDGDGVEDTLLTSFVNLGDEAPSYIELEVYLGGTLHTEIIDRAYGIEEVRAYEDEDGSRGLAIIYAQGDYYIHDNPAACTLSWNGQELVVEYLE